MKALTKSLFIIGFFLALAPQANALDLWYPSGNYLRPNLNGWGVMVPSLGGSGTRCLQVDNSGIFSKAVAGCGSGGGGSSGGTFSTTTSSVLNQLINYPNNDTDIVCIGNSATTTCEYYFDPNLPDAFLTSIRVTRSTTTNATTTSLFSSTASSTNLFSTNATFGTVTSGLINGQTISSAASFTGTVNITSGLTTLSNLLLTGSSTLQNYTGVNGTTTNSTSTSVYTTTLGVNSEYFNDLTGNGLSISAGSLTATLGTTIAPNELVGQPFTSNFPLVVNTAGTGFIATTGPLYMDIISVLSTSTSATTTNFFATTASTTNLFGSNLATCDPTTGKLTWSSGRFGCGTDFNTGGSGGSGNVATSSAETSGRVPFWTSTAATPATLSGGVAGFTFDSAINQLTVTSSVVTNATNTNATSTNLNVSGSVDFDTLTSALIITGAGGVLAEYAGTSCTNQFVRSLSVLGAATCDSVDNGDFGDADWGDITIASNVASVEDDSHAHTGATLSGIDISDDTNLTAGDNLTLTGDDIDLDTTLTSMTAATFSGLVTAGNFLATGSSTLQNFTFVNATGSAATTTSFFATTASTTNFFGAGLTTCQSNNVLTWAAGQFGCEADDGGAGGDTPGGSGTEIQYRAGAGTLGAIAGTAVSVGGVYTGFGTSTPKWLLQLASSTAPQLTLSDGSLTSNHWSFRNAGGNLYLATSSPSTFASSTQQGFALLSNSTIQLPATSGCAPTATGTLCYDTARGTLAAGSGGPGGVSATAGTIARVVAAARSGQGLTNSTTADQDFTAIYTIPANHLVANKFYRITLNFETVAGASAVTAQTYLKLGSTKIYLSGTANWGDGLTRSMATQFYVVGTAAAGASVDVEGGMINGMGNLGNAGATNSVDQPVTGIATNGALTIAPGITYSGTGSTETATLLSYIVEEIN